MAWRTVSIQNPAKLSLKRAQLCLENEKGECTLPLEDITVLILESPQISVTSAFLSHCQENGVVIMTCDTTHTPNGLMLPFLRHSRQAKIAHLQIGWSEPLKKRLWQKVIQAKIRNQATCLEQVKDKESARALFAMAERVQSGDPDNLEAQAARYYWGQLFGKDFRRGANDAVNAALNYGYAVLRAFVARAQVAYGLIPAFGIHHDNDLNAFNLTDDMMEPFRPLADREVVIMVQEGILVPEMHSLDTALRGRLAGLGIALCESAGQVHTVGNASEKMAASLVACIEGKTASLLVLPEFPPAKEVNP